MKKLLIVLLSALSLTAFAQQQPRIAIYVTGEDPMNEIIANRMTEGFKRSGKYIPVERSAAFLLSIAKEHSYERSGEVADEQIRELGKFLSVQYVCVVSVLDVWEDEKYITTRIIDATTAEVIGSCSSNGSISNGDDLMTALDDLTIKLREALDYSKNAETKKVAVYVTKTGNRDIDIILGDQLVASFARCGNYIAVERTNAFLKQLQKETGFQQSGAVNDSDIIQLGKKFGVQYVCVSKTTPWKGSYFISSKLIDVESTETIEIYNAENKIVKSSKDVVLVAREIAENLTKGSSIGIYGKSYMENVLGINMKMIWVRGGDFLMGCTPDQNGYCNDNEKNVRRVKLDGFYIGMLEVTQSQWEKITGTNINTQLSMARASYLNGDGPDYPMYYVSWEDAMEFCQILSDKTGKKYTLPTEAQWEYAARGGSLGEDKTYAGSDILTDVAWYDENSGGYSHPCGTKRANPIGIYDMSGNVWEWCRDWYKSDYNSSDIDNPIGPSSGTERVNRGGGFYNDILNTNIQDKEFIERVLSMYSDPEERERQIKNITAAYTSFKIALERKTSFCRVAYRGYNNPNKRYQNVGFRVVCIP